MPEYGITENGLNVKRYNEIANEIHDELSKSWGVNTRLNQESLLNVLVTNIADKIAELWEYGAGIYYAMYPSTAEGTPLDYAAQFGGVTRKMDAPSYYPIHCKGIDGTMLLAGTRIASNTNPPKEFYVRSATKISRDSFNEATIKCASHESEDTYTVFLNDVAYSYSTSTQEDELNIYNGLKKAIMGNDTEDSENSPYIVDVVQNVDNTWNLKIALRSKGASAKLALSENLTTNYVVSIITFVSADMGDIYQPPYTITEIKTNQSGNGFYEVWNEGDYIAGRLRETDVELRKSYIDKIFGMSTRMCESIKAELLNLQGVKSVSVYENTTNHTTWIYEIKDKELTAGDYQFLFDGLYYKFNIPITLVRGDSVVFYTENKKFRIFKNMTPWGNELGGEVRSTEFEDVPLLEDFYSEIYPHGVEAIVDGGSEMEIANVILATKAAGINTYGDQEVEVPDKYDGTITIRFNKPRPVYVWFEVKCEKNIGEMLPENAVGIIKSVILEKMDDLSAGDSLYPQKWIGEIYRRCTGLSYVEIKMWTTREENIKPEEGDYTLKSTSIKVREKAISNGDRIKVVDENGNRLL